MAESKAFVLWFLENIPDFLISQPISSFVGFAFLAIVIKLFKQIIGIGKGV